ncbi:MAG: UDP-N-acetylmuramoyl-L-alanyl-D-glutamate--2,6-diaminopimelate ligase [Gemmatimonadaceae bacterium]
MPIPLTHITAALTAADLLVETRGALPAHISSIADDSRRLTRGGLFVAVRGATMDGHDYLDRARAAGAAAAIVEDAARAPLPAIVVRDGRRAAAVAAAAAYDFPARHLCLVAITGTNGKTTTAHMLRHLLDEDGAAASIGTVGVLVGSEGRAVIQDPGLTTPGPVELQRILRALVDAGVHRVAMEVSSHALHQHRVDGLAFDVAVFTNLSRDHLDYHQTMDAYREAKERLCAHLAPPPHGIVVVNADDPVWRALATDRRKVEFSTHSSVEVHAHRPRYTPRGSEWTLVAGTERFPVRLPLIGDFNVSNAVAAAAAAYALGVPTDTIARRLGTVPQVPGRLEVVGERPTVLRDYAHTPDALARALGAVRPFVSGRLLVVFGCGGDRDRGKRPEMGGIAERLADLAIVTSDNPRTEDPEAILDDIEAGMTAGRHERIEDRRDAIARALALAGSDDVVLLAGKGHETYQLRGTERLPFDEKAIVAELTRVRA